MELSRARTFFARSVISRHVRFPRPSSNLVFRTRYAKPPRRMDRFSASGLTQKFAVSPMEPRNPPRSLVRIWKIDSARATPDESITRDNPLCRGRKNYGRRGSSGAKRLPRCAVFSPGSRVSPCTPGPLIFPTTNGSFGNIKKIASSSAQRPTRANETRVFRSN